MRGGVALSFVGASAFASTSDGYLSTDALRLEAEKRNSGGDGTSLWLDQTFQLALPKRASVFLPWDASEHEAAMRIGALLSDDSTVHAMRDGDGHEQVTFTFVFLGLGDRPTLRATTLGLGSSRLAKSTPAPPSNASAPRTDELDAVAVTVTELVAGGTDVAPIPGRYITAPSSEPVASVRLNLRSTARCAAIAWDDLFVGCYHLPNLTSIERNDGNHSVWNATYFHILSKVRRVAMGRRLPLNCACPATYAHTSIATPPNPS